MAKGASNDPDAGRRLGHRMGELLGELGPLEPDQRRWLVGLVGGLTDALAELAHTPAPPGATQIGVHWQRPPQTTAFSLRVTDITELAGHEGKRQIVSFDWNADSLAEPGSLLALWPSNEPDEVRHLLHLLGASPHSTVELGKHRVPAWRALLEIVRLDEVTPRLCLNLAESARLPAEATALRALVDAPMRPTTLVALLHRFPSARPPLSELVQWLRPLTPQVVPLLASARTAERALSVLTKKVPRATQLGEVDVRLEQQLRVGEWLNASVLPSPFAFPDAANASIILFVEGAGTAIARSLMLERLSRRSKARTWVIGLTSGTAPLPLDGEFASGHSRKHPARYDRHEVTELGQGMSDLKDAFWRWLLDGAHCYLLTERTETEAAVVDWLLELGLERGMTSVEAARGWLDELAASARLVRMPAVSALARLSNLS